MKWYDGQGPVVYRWPCGSTVRVLLSDDLEYAILRVVDVENPGVRIEHDFSEGACVALTLSPMISGPASDPHRLYVNDDYVNDESGVFTEDGRPALYVGGASDIHSLRMCEPKIVGLCLDLGVDRFYPFFRGLVTTNLLKPSEASYPRFVPEEVWAGRHEMARRYYAPNLGFSADEHDALGLPPFLGWIRHFEVMTGKVHFSYGSRWLGRSDGFTSISSRDGTAGRPRVDVRKIVPTYWAPTFEAVVDELLRSELVLPASRKDAWEAEHVDRGEFVLPTAEEAELFNLLGEMLPFFWPYPALRAWVVEREPQIDGVLP